MAPAEVPRLAAVASPQEGQSAAPTLRGRQCEEAQGSRRRPEFGPAADSSATTSSVSVLVATPSYRSRQAALRADGALEDLSPVFQRDVGVSSRRQLAQPPTAQPAAGVYRRSQPPPRWRAGEGSPEPCPLLCGSARSSSPYQRLPRCRCRPLRARRRCRPLAWRRRPQPRPRRVCRGPAIRVGSYASLYGSLHWRRVGAGHRPAPRIVTSCGRRAASRCGRAGYAALLPHPLVPACASTLPTPAGRGKPA